MLHSDQYLPREVLSHIFSFLKISDKRNVRQTCSKWYNACNTLSLLQNEKIVINQYDASLEKQKHQSSSEFCLDVLMKSPRLRFNFDFKYLFFSEHSSVFWQKCGSRIESLKLEFCHFETESADKMIKFCNNLKELYINECDELFHWNQRDELEISHESLRSLTLVNCSYISDFEFSKLFVMYPCIKKLELNCMRLNCHKRVDARFYKPDAQYFHSKSIFTFSCLYAHIKSNATNINALIFDKVGTDGITSDWLEDMASLQELRLKELKLDFHPHLSEKAFLKFFSSQIYLEYFSVSKCQHFSLTCFLHVIQKCSNLKSIKAECLEASPNFSKSKEILLALMLLPSLKILKLTGPFCMDENVSCVAPTTAITFRSLRRLTLKMPAIYYDIFTPRLPFNLSALHLLTKGEDIGLTDEKLQLIFDKWLNLRSLKLSLNSDVSDFGFTGRKLNSHETETNDSGISIKRLTRLEKLSLVCNQNSNISITEVSFSHFVFPELLKLELINFGKISEKSFDLLCLNTPMVECIHFKNCQMVGFSVSNPREHWKNLRYTRRNGEKEEKLLCFT